MKNIVYYIAIATVLLFASCASELDTEPSGSQVSDEQLAELIKENADLVLAPMMQGAVNYMHTGNRQATTNDRGFMVWNLGMDLQGNDMVLTKLTNWFADEYMFESIRAQTNAYTADRWYCYYKIVYQSNQILDLIPDDVTGKALVYKAQALTSWRSAPAFSRWRGRRRERSCAVICYNTAAARAAGSIFTTLQRGFPARKRSRIAGC